jgi:hypothetical protein
LERACKTSKITFKSCWHKCMEELKKYP